MTVSFLLIHRLHCARVLPRTVAAMLALVLLGATLPAQGASLTGSRSSVKRQHRQANSHDYTRLKNPQHVRKFVNLGLLVPVRGNRNYRVAGARFPYARPEVKLFIERLSRQYRAATGEPLVVTSLTRPLSHQPRNASRYSVHPTGMAIDIRRSRSGTARKWLERNLIVLEQRGVLEATAERHPLHYHVAIYPQQYAAYVKKKTARPATTPTTAANQATYLTYRVQYGDSLWAIARRHRTTVSRIKNINAISGTRIVPGQKLYVPRS
jgi:LysM repeat protein